LTERKISFGSNENQNDSISLLNSQEEKTEVKRHKRKFIVGVNISPDGRVKNSPAFESSLQIVDAVKADKRSCKYNFEMKMLDKMKPKF